MVGELAGREVGSAVHMVMSGLTYRHGCRLLVSRVYRLLCLFLGSWRSMSGVRGAGSVE